jgi:Zinc carboxypeptidase
MLADPGIQAQARHRRTLMRCAVTIGAVVGLTAAAPLGGQSALPTPEAFFGFPMGADRQLADWRRTVEYFRTIDRLSDRVVVQELGPTTSGLPYIVAIVSAPATIADLPRHQAEQRRLADPRVTAEPEAARIAREGKAVVLIGGSVHANEIGSSQMMNDLLYDLAAGNDDWARRVLDDTIVLLVPSQNPDGHQTMAEWHEQNRGTPWEDAPLPELYHRYAGHDNNRDSYMLTQVETRYLAQLTYRDWLPEVYLDQHQMGSGRARIFVPPFKNPPNPNVDPLVWSEVNLLGQAMAARLQAAGKTGIFWGEVYSGFWQGANSTNPWWHNMIALLTEVASARLAAPIFQQVAPDEAPAAERPRPVPGDLQIPPPTDLQFRMNYPEPWRGGRWTFADVVEYHKLAAVGLLEAVAGHREMLKRNFYLMNRRSIERFARGRPYAFVVPIDQHDPGTAAHLLRLLQAGGAEVHRARSPFTAGGIEHPAGTPVVLLAQPFGRWVKDLLEPQRYPDIRWPSPSAPIDRPYDMTAWSLGMLMGVRTIEIDRPFTADLELLADDAPPPPGGVSGTGATWILPHEPNASITATHRLLDAGADVAWLTGELRLDGRVHPPGSIIVQRADGKALSDAAVSLGLDAVATEVMVPAERLLPLSLPRVAVYEPWGGSIDAGWTRWAFEQHELPYTRVRHTDVLREDFATRFDVLVLPEMPDTVMLRGLQGPGVRPEHRGGLGEEGTARLRAFVERGGTVVTLGNSAEFAIEQLAVPVTNIVADEPAESFFCPGSILRIDVDTGHPIGYGMPREAAAMFVNNGGYLPTGRAGLSVAAPVRYPQAPLLMSGWIVGEPRLRGTSAVLDVAMGQGRVIMLTFRVQNRGQALGTFKLLFNSILYGPASTAMVAPAPTQQF